MNLRNSLLILVSLMMISCSTNQPKPIIVSTEHINTCVEPPEENVMVMRKVKPEVIEDKTGIFWVGLTGKDYENLSLNFNDILVHLKQQNARIRFYEECK